MTDRLTDGRAIVYSALCICCRALKLSQSQRQVEGLAPPAPNCVQYELSNGRTKRFLLYDSGCDDNNGIVERLRHSPRCYADGTFETAPLLFLSSLCDSGESLGTVRPLLYCCEPVIAIVNPSVCLSARTSVQLSVTRWHCVNDSCYDHAFTEDSPMTPVSSRLN